MELIVVFLVASLVPTSLQKVLVGRDKRQIDPQCFATYLYRLDPAEQRCINPTDTSNFDLQLEGVCSNATCRSAAKKLLVGCRVCHVPCHLC